MRNGWSAPLAPGEERLLSASVAMLPMAELDGKC